MLLAQRKEPEFNPQETSPDCLPVAAPSHVLSSIEDLRRLAQEITLDQIKDAAEKASLMVRRLSSLQAACANVVVIGQFVARVERARLQIPEEQCGWLENEISQQTTRNPGKASEDVGFSHSDAPSINAVIDAPFQTAAAGAPFLVIDSQPTAPNPAWEAGVHLTAASHADLPETQRSAFTLGDNQLGEQKFELGVSLTHGRAETKPSAPAEDHYAVLAPTPEATSAPTFSFRRDQESTVLSATPEVDPELLPLGFFDQMINSFTAFVGPMAALIVEEQVASLGELLTAFPRSRFEELIALVSREILDDQAKARFQKQMAEKVRTLASQPLPASQRKKND